MVLVAWFQQLWFGIWVFATVVPVAWVQEMAESETVESGVTFYAGEREILYLLSDFLLLVPGLIRFGETEEICSSGLRRQWIWNEFQQVQIEHSGSVCICPVRKGAR